MMEPLFIDDDELIRLTGMSKEVLIMFERTHPAFPKLQKTMGNKRYWPAVKAYLDSVYGLKLPLLRSKPNAAA